MIKNINIQDEPGTIEAGKLQYGTVVAGVTSHPDSFYMKIDKRKLGQGLHLSFPDKHTVLLNLKTGALRAVPGSQRVKVFSCELNAVRIEDFQDYIKNGGFC